MNFKHRFNHKDHRGFPDIKYPFEHGEVINYTLGGVSIHLVTTKIQTPFLTQFTKSSASAQGFHHEANGDFKTVRV